MNSQHWSSRAFWRTRWRDVTFAFIENFFGNLFLFLFQSAIKYEERLLKLLCRYSFYGAIILFIRIDTMGFIIIELRKKERKRKGEEEKKKMKENERKKGNREMHIKNANLILFLYLRLICIFETFYSIEYWIRKSTGDVIWKKCTVTHTTVNCS